MSRTLQVVLIAAGLIGTSAAFAYEISTHALLTFNAYAHARLGADSTLLANLGLLESELSPISTQRSFGKISFDIFGDQVRLRFPDAYEFLAMKRIEESITAAGYDLQSERDRTRIPGWLMAGAIREDDNPAEGPQDDSYVPNHAFDREFNHFFDPARNRPLTILGWGLGQYYAIDANGVSTIRRAPDWALGVDDAFSGNAMRGTDHLNHFTILDAREAMWRALTLTRMDSWGILYGLPLSTIPGNTSSQALRDAYWASTFRDLGDVLHLNQDMAQPQHTRNEAHSGAKPIFLQGPLLGHESTMEKYIDARARQLKSFNVAGQEVAPLQPLGFDDYQMPHFDRYGYYWSTGVAGVSPTDQLQNGYVTGKGLADYSNRGFFTAVNNFGTTEFNYPSSDPAKYIVESTTLPYPNTQGTIHKQYLKGTVTDSVANSSATIRMTTRGVFDDVVIEYGVAPVDTYMIDANVMDDQAALLIPRAIAYSAGLLDYFFRGEIAISLPADGVYSVVDHTQNSCPDTCGFFTIKARVQNTTPGNESMAGGILVAVVKYHRNLCYRSDLSGDPGGPQFDSSICRSAEEEITTSDKLTLSTLAANATQAVKFTFSQPIPINATDIYLQVVYRGVLGNEADAVVVATKNISEPNYVAVANDYDYKYDAATDTFQAATPTPPYQFITQIDVKVGNTPVPIAILAQLGPRQYAQLAFLTDLGASGTENVVIDFTANGIGSPLTYSSFPIAAFDSTGSTAYQRSRNMYPYRGMWRDFAMEFFQGSQQYMMYLCAPPVDTRRICTSAGLTPFTSTNAVPWNINFP